MNAVIGRCPGSPQQAICPPAFCPLAICLSPRIKFGQSHTPGTRCNTDIPTSFHMTACPTSSRRAICPISRVDGCNCPPCAIDLAIQMHCLRCFLLETLAIQRALRPGSPMAILRMASPIAAGTATDSLIASLKPQIQLRRFVRPACKIDLTLIPRSRYIYTCLYMVVPVWL